MGRDGIGMTTQDWDPRAPSPQDWDPRAPSGWRDSPSGPPQPADLVREAYGLPVQDVPSAGRTYQPSPAARGGIVSAGLGITDVVAYNVLPGYAARPGMALGWITLGLRRNAKKRMTGPETKGRRIALRAAGALGMLGFLLLVVGTGHGDALNGAGLS